MYFLQIIFDINIPVWTTNNLQLVSEIFIACIRWCRKLVMYRNKKSTRERGWDVGTCT